MKKKLLIFVSFFVATFQIRPQQITCVDLSSKSTTLFFWQAIETLGIENKALNECIKQVEEENNELNKEIKEIVEEIWLITKKTKGCMCETCNNCEAKTIDNGTISEPGLYRVTVYENVYIEIDSDNVTIDLCERTLSGTLSAIPIIAILNGHKNITIKNGALNGSDKTNNGIFLEENTQSIVIENVDFLHCNLGIVGEGSESQPAFIENISVKNCSFTDCNKAISFSYAKNCICQNCDASECAFSGFELKKGSYNTIENCKALSTGNDDPETSAVAFSSFDCTGNLFSQCIAEGTFKDASNFGQNATGFLLNSQEKETKIIDCIANSANCTGNGTAYGIHLNMTLKNQADIVKTQVETYGDDLYTAAWSPNSKHVAIGGKKTNHGLGPRNLYILNVKDNNFGTIAAPPIAAELIDEIKWSPNGQFLAAGISDSGDASLGLYAFKPKKANPDDRLELLFNSFVSIPELSMSIVLGIGWSPDGKYIAILSLQTDKKTVKLAVLHFDGENTKKVENIEVDAYEQALSPDDINPFIGDLSFSADGKRIAVVHNADGATDQPAIVVYTFNPIIDIFLGHSILSPEIRENIPDLSKVHSVDFSPVACLEKNFIAVGGKDKVKVFTQKVGSLALAAERDLRDSTTVKWAQNGKYVLVMGSNNGVRTLPVIYEFEYSETTANLNRKILINLEGGTPPASCDWSPSGRYFINVSTQYDYGPAEENIYIYEVGNVPQKCIVENNQICKTTGNSCGIGIEGASGENFIVKNTGYENTINFSRGIFNHFVDGLNHDPKKLDNISVPLYFSDLAVES